ncbi:MAG: exodeoxyribonuclease VII small subunit [Thermomicrobiales bacterium]
MIETPAPDSHASFEETLMALQNIVEALEQGHLPLSETIAHFEAGTRLAEYCQKLVADAELRITVLTERDDDLDVSEEDDDDLFNVPF